MIERTLPVQTCSPVEVPLQALCVSGSLSAAGQARSSDTPECVQYATPVGLSGLRHSTCCLSVRQLRRSTMICPC